MSQAVGGVYEHSGVFTFKKNCVLTAIGVLGVTALVIGILSYLQLLPGVPAAAMYSLLGVGGALVLADIIAMIVLLVSHHKTNQFLKDYLNDEDSEWWRSSYEQVIEPTADQKKHFVLVPDLHKGKEIKTVALNNNGVKEVHIFNDMRQYATFHNHLQKQNFVKKPLGVAI